MFDARHLVKRMELYHHPQSTYSQKVLIALYEKKIVFEHRVVDLSNAGARAAYEKIYPMGRLPLLRIDEEFCVPESTSIVEFIDETSPPTPSLVRFEEPGRALQVRFIDRISDLYINDPVVFLLHTKNGMRPFREQDVAQSRRYLDTSYCFLNTRLCEASWVCGDDFTMADCALIPALRLAREVHSFHRFTAISEYVEAALRRPACKRAFASNGPISAR